MMKVDPKTGSVESRRAVCKTPRGMAYNSATDDLHVVCAEGELVTLKARGGDVVRTVRIDDDLRDVVVRGSSLLISRFPQRRDSIGGQRRQRCRGGRSRESCWGRAWMPQVRTTASPTTAWRMVGLPSGSVAVLHQRAPRQSDLSQERRLWHGAVHGQRHLDAWPDAVPERWR